MQHTHGEAVDYDAGCAACRDVEIDHTWWTSNGDDRQAITFTSDARGIVEVELDALETLLTATGWVKQPHPIDQILADRYGPHVITDQAAHGTAADAAPH